MTDTPSEPFHFAPAEEAQLTRGAGSEIDTALVRDLAAILAETNLTTIEVERGDLKIRVAREVTIAAAPLAYTAPAPAVAPTAATAGGALPPPAAAEPKGDAVTSPMVGTVYLQAKPGDPLFIKVGDTVGEGQTLLIVEAMKTMNPIPSPRAGRVAQIMVGDSQPVEYGEPLVVLE